MEEIEVFLAKIGWSLRDHGCEHYFIYNHRKVCTDLKLVFPKTDGRLEYERSDVRSGSRFPKFYFYLKDCVMELLENEDAVSFKGKDSPNIFILLMNHDR